MRAMVTGCVSKSRNPLRHLWGASEDQSISNKNCSKRISSRSSYHPYPKVMLCILSSVLNEEEICALPLEELIKSDEITCVVKTNRGYTILLIDNVVPKKGMWNSNSRSFRVSIQRLQIICVIRLS